MRGSVPNYSYRAVWSAEDEAYVATSAEFPGATAFGETPDEAIRELQIAITGITEVMLEDGQQLPEPFVVPEHSGQFRLRLPKSIHAQLAYRADVEGVSANALVQTYIAAGLQGDFATTSASIRFQHVAARLELAAQITAASVESIERVMAPMESANLFSPPPQKASFLFNSASAVAPH